MGLTKFTGSTQMDGSEDSLFKIVGTTMKHFATYVYLKALQAGESIRLRVYNKVDDVSQYKFDGDVIDSIASNNGTVTYNSNLKALWKFEQNLNDSTTNGFNLTLGAGNTIYTSGQEGYALQFDGSTIYTASSSSIVTGTADRSFSFWIKTPSTFITSKYIYSYGANTNNNLWLFEWTSTASTSGFTLFTGGVGGQNISSNTILQPSTWYHIIITLGSTGTLLTFYVNGVQDKQSTVTTLNTSSSSLFLGGFIDGIPYVQSGVLLDEFRSYNVILSSSQASALYMLGNLGQSHTFDGGEYISFGSTSTWTFLHSNAGSTVAFWSKLPVGSYSSTPLLMGTHNTSGGTIGFVVEIDSNGKIYYLIGNGSGTLYLNCTTNNSAYTNDGTWHHLAFVFNGTNGAIYLDGVSLTLAVNTLTGSASTANSTDVLIMGTSPALSGNNLIGQLDDVRLINRALSSAEISDLYTYPDSAMKTLVYDKTYSGVKSDAIYIPVLQGNNYMVTATQTGGTNRIIYWEREEII